MMRVILLPLAIEDLQQLRNYIAQFNPEAAKDVADKIKKSLNMLSEQPHMGHPAEDDDVLEWHIPTTNYSLPYQVVDNTVQILRVFDERQNRPGSWE